MLNRDSVLKYLNNYRVRAGINVSIEDAKFLAQYLDYKGKEGITVAKVIETFKSNSQQYVISKIDEVINKCIEEFDLNIHTQNNGSNIIVKYS